MALIKCSNCNANVSDKATICPKCNKPINNQKRAAIKGVLFYYTFCIMWWYMDI